MSKVNFMLLATFPVIHPRPNRRYLSMHMHEKYGLFMAAPHVDTDDIARWVERLPEISLDDLINGVCSGNEDLEDLKKRVGKPIEAEWLADPFEVIVYPKGGMQLQLNDGRLVNVPEALEHVREDNSEETRVMIEAIGRYLAAQGLLVSLTTTGMLSLRAWLETYQNEEVPNEH